MSGISFSLVINPVVFKPHVQAFVVTMLQASEKSQPDDSRGTTAVVAGYGVYSNPMVGLNQKGLIIVLDIEYNPSTFRREVPDDISAFITYHLNGEYYALWVKRAGSSEVPAAIRKTERAFHGLVGQGGHTHRANYSLDFRKPVSHVIASSTPSSNLPPPGVGQLPGRSRSSAVSSGPSDYQNMNGNMADYQNRQGQPSDYQNRNGPASDYQNRPVG